MKKNNILKQELVPADICTYGCADELPEDDSRHVVYSQQRKSRGFDDTELWSLDISMAEFILPRLKAYRDLMKQRTIFAIEDEVNDMIAAFEIICTDNFKARFEDEPEFEVVRRGLKAFSEYYLALWS